MENRKKQHQDLCVAMICTQATNHSTVHETNSHKTSQTVIIQKSRAQIVQPGFNSDFVRQIMTSGFKPMTFLLHGFRCWDIRFR